MYVQDAGCDRCGTNDRAPGSVLCVECQPDTAVGHTPGPWTYQPLAGHHDFAVYPEDVTATSDVALVRDFNEANARLIAAAPEMLEALKGAENLIAAHSTGIVKGAWPDTLAVLRAAIAKATGQ